MINKTLLKKYINKSFNQTFLNLPFSNKLIVLNFHRIVRNDNINNILSTKINDNFFYKYLKFLNNNFEIISPTQLINNNIKFAKKEKFKILITFDDGYYDNFNIAFPILKKLKIKPIFFICPTYISSNKKLWDEDLVDRIKKLMGQKNIFKFQDIILQKNLPDFSQNLFKIINILKFYDNSKRQNVINKILPYQYLDQSSDERCMNWNEIKILSQNDMHIGCHTNTHTSLGKLDKYFFKDELLNSKLEIEKQTNKECNFFAFPYGSKNDYNLKVIKSLKNIGYKKTFLNFGYINSIDSDIYCYHRISLTNSFDNDIIFRLL